MEKPKIFSFFSGIGFLDLGFEKTGYSILYVNENHPPFLDAYKYSRLKLKLNEPLYGYCPDSVENFTEGEIKSRLRELVFRARRSGSTIGFIGGPPCPDFSIGGKNRGHRGDHGRLTRTYFEIICQQKPDFFLFENVKGLWQTKKHRAFYNQQKLVVQESGYVLTDRLINTIEYKSPQDRERVILIGFKREFLSDLDIGMGNYDELFLNGYFPWLKYATYPDRTAFHEYSWPKIDTFEKDSLRDRPKDIPVELTVEHWFRKNNVLNHPNTKHCFKPKAGLKRFLAVAEGDDSKKSFKRLHRWRYSPTACYGNNEVHLHPYKPRRISAAESLSIQSLPTEFELPESMSLTNMFKAIGNGVPYLAAKELAKTILLFLGISNETNSI